MISLDVLYNLRDKFSASASAIALPLADFNGKAYTILK